MKNKYTTEDIIAELEKTVYCSKHGVLVKLNDVKALLEAKDECERSVSPKSSVKIEEPASVMCGTHNSEVNWEFERWITKITDAVNLLNSKIK